jgi:hypothetical protein
MVESKQPNVPRWYERQLSPAKQKQLALHFMREHGEAVSAKDVPELTEPLMTDDGLAVLVPYLTMPIADAVREYWSGNYFPEKYKKSYGIKKSQLKSLYLSADGYEAGKMKWVRINPFVFYLSGLVRARRKLAKKLPDWRFASIEALWLLRVCPQIVDYWVANGYEAPSFYNHKTCIDTMSYEAPWILAGFHCNKRGLVKHTLRVEKWCSELHSEVSPKSMRPAAIELSVYVDHLVGACCTFPIVSDI